MYIYKPKSSLMKYIFFTIVLSFLLGACTTTSFVLVDVLKPADITFSEKTKNKNILIVDNAAISTNDRVLLKKYVPVLEDSVRKIITHSFLQFMNEEQSFSSVKALDRTTNKGYPLSLPTVKNICSEESADILISLDSIKIGYDTKYEFDVENGYTVSDYVRLSGYISGVLSVYDNSGRQIGKSIAYKEELYSKIGFGFDPQEYAKEETSKLISELSILTADRLTGIFIPSWRTQDRYFFSNNSSEMKQAANYIEDGEWTAAANIWKKQYQIESNKTRKGQLAFNIALANECVDNISAASEWIDKASTILSETKNSKLQERITEYKKAIGERTSNANILKRQFELLK